VGQGWHLVDGPQPKLYAVEEGLAAADLAGSKAAELAAARADLTRRCEELQPLGWQVSEAYSAAELTRLRVSDRTFLDPAADPYVNDLADPSASGSLLQLRQQVLDRLCEARKDLGGDTLLASRARVQGEERQAYQERRQQELADVFAKLQQWDQQNPRDPMLHEMWGLYHATILDLTAAIQSLQNAILLRPDLPRLRFNLAECYVNSGLAQQAVIEMTRALSLERSLLQGYRWFIRFFMQQQDWAGARAWLEALRGAWDGSDAFYDGMGKVRDQIEKGLKERPMDLRAVENFPDPGRIPAGVLEEGS
jgi:hypothetical protein